MKSFSCKGSKTLENFLCNGILQEGMGRAKWEQIYFSRKSRDIQARTMATICRRCPWNTDDWPQYYPGWCWSLPPCPRLRSHWQSSSAPATGACRRVVWWQSEPFSLASPAKGAKKFWSPLRVRKLVFLYILVFFSKFTGEILNFHPVYLYRVKNTLKASSLSVTRMNKFSSISEIYLTFS